MSTLEWVEMETRAKFAHSAAKVLGVDLAEMLERCTSETDMQMLVERKAVAFAERFHERRQDAAEVIAFTQQRVQAIREVDPEQPAQSEINIDAGNGAGGAGWYSGADPLPAA